MRSIQENHPTARRATRNGGFGVLRLSQPMANVLENENGFTIELATPGYSKEDLKISLKKGVLIIEGKGEDNDSARYARREFGIGGFTKRFRLSENVDRDAVIADYQDGVLKVVLPNRPEDKKRDITIS